MKTATAPLPPLRSVKVLDQLRERIRFTCITAYQPNRLCPLGSCLHPFPRCASPGNLGQRRSRGISVLAGERAQGFGLHASSGIGGLAVLLRQVLCWICPGFQEIGRPRPSRRLPVVLTPDEVVRILGFWKASIVCSPSFCMERACGSVRVCNCGSRIWISITARSSCGGKGSKDRALMLPEGLAPSLREQLSRARAWWLKDQAEAAAALRFPTPLSGSIRAPGIPGRGSGFCAAHAFDRSTGGVVRRHHIL